MMNIFRGFSDDNFFRMAVILLYLYWLDIRRYLLFKMIIQLNNLFN